MASLTTLNRWARKSCTRWNRGRFRFTRQFHRLSRCFYRKLYRHAARKYWESDDARRRIKQYQDGYFYFNTYPWPYCDPHFANWVEDDSTEGYTLISDQSNFIIRHSTSYCAWKIFESTGHWPQRKSHKRFDARLWQEFLSEAGYETIVTEPQPKRRYVGVDEHHEGEFGEVVWYEKPCDQEKERSKVIVSTYRGKKYVTDHVDPQRYLWIQII